MEAVARVCSQLFVPEAVFASSTGSQQVDIIKMALVLVNEQFAKCFANQSVVAKIMD